MQISKITIILMIIICVCALTTLICIYMYVLFQKHSVYVIICRLFSKKKNNEGIYLKSFFLVQDYNKNIPKY